MLVWYVRGHRVDFNADPHSVEPPVYDSNSHSLAILLSTRLNAAQKNLSKKLLGEKDVEGVLQRLHRLTQDEAWITAAQTLEVVYGLVQNMRVVMDGEQLRVR
jgi:hypothetical protein